MLLRAVAALIAVAGTAASAHSEPETARGVGAGFIVGAVDRGDRSIVVGAAGSLRQRLGRVVGGLSGQLASGGYRHLGLSVQLDLALGRPTFHQTRPRMYVELGAGLGSRGGAISSERAPVSATSAGGRGLRPTRFISFGLEWGYNLSMTAVFDRVAGPTVFVQTGPALFW